jgi:hypothetical protein
MSGCGNLEIRNEVVEKSKNLALPHIVDLYDEERILSKYDIALFMTKARLKSLNPDVTQYNFICLRVPSALYSLNSLFVSIGSYRDCRQ